MDDIFNLPLTQLGLTAAIIRKFISFYWFFLAYSMDHLQMYSDSMETTEELTTIEGREASSPSIVPFRSKSLLFATFPWATVLPVIDAKLVEHIGDGGEERYAFVSVSIINSWQALFKAFFLFYFILFYLKNGV
jgi:hypothetical protein